VRCRRGLLQQQRAGGCLLLRRQLALLHLCALGEEQQPLLRLDLRSGEGGEKKAGRGPSVAATTGAGEASG
jgi:hypothetical protein